MRVVDLMNVMGKVVAPAAGFVEEDDPDDIRIILDYDAIPDYPVRIVIREEPPTPHAIYDAAIVYGSAMYDFGCDVGDRAADPRARSDRAVARRKELKRLLGIGDD